MAKGREHGAEGREEKRFERHRAESMEQRAIRKSALRVPSMPYALCPVPAGD
jgi:hypothetical protein